MSIYTHRCIHCNSPLLRWGEGSEVIRVNHMVSEREYKIHCDHCGKDFILKKVWWADSEPALREVVIHFRSCDNF